MAGIPIFQFAGIQVQATHEKGHEHIAVVPPAQFPVKLRQDTRRTLFLLGYHPEQGVDHGHQHGRRNPLPGHVADTEEQFAVTGKKVEKVPAHLPGRFQGTIEEGRELLGQHFPLNPLGDSQFSAHPSLFFGSFAKFGFTSDEPLDDKGQDRQRQKNHQNLLPAHLPDAGEHLPRTIHLHDLPVRFPVHLDTAERHVLPRTFRRALPNHFQNGIDIGLGSPALRRTGNQLPFLGKKKAE